VKGEAHKVKTYPDVHYLARKLITVGEVVVTTYFFECQHMVTFFSLSHLHEIRAQSLWVLFLHSRDVKLHNHFMNSTKERTGLFTISMKSSSG
jgi:predicted ester cyclase